MLGRARGYWRFPTNAGLFRIVPYHGRYRVMWENDLLGSEPTPRKALESLIYGKTLVRPPEAARRTLPKDLRSWNFVSVLINES